jgi:hypothetical protein
MPIIRTTIEVPEIKTPGTTLFHVYVKETGRDHYFGSIAAIYQEFTRFNLGVSQQRLYDYKILPDKPYANKKCIISKHVVSRKKGGRGR